MPLDYRIAERTLANGLRVIVSEDHSVPNVTVNLWVNVGSRHETQGRTGFAHLFEHLMFQGSRNVANGEHFSALMAEGGRLNATTWFDRTNYFETVPKGAPRARALDGGRPARPPARRGDPGEPGQPARRGQGGEAAALRQRALRQRARSTVRRDLPQGHPYHHPTIGSMDDLDAASLEDVHAFFRRFYGPNNTVLTLVGDLDAGGGVRRRRAVLRPLPASAEPPPRGRRAAPLAEPCATSTSRTSRRTGCTWPSGCRWTTPRSSSPPRWRWTSSAAWRRPGSTSGWSAASRSPTACRPTRWASSTGCRSGFIGIDVAEGASADEVEAHTCEELRRFAAEGPTDVEMESALAQTERAWLSALASQEERADAHLPPGDAARATRAGSTRSSTGWRR